MNDLTLKYLLLLLYFGITFFMGLWILPKIIAYFLKTDILDEPNWRSAHKQPTPSSGGMSFVITAIVMTPFLFESNQLTTTIIASTGLGLMGYIDDRKVLKPNIKFVIQMVAASALFFSGLNFNFLNGLFALGEINYYLSFLISIVFIVGVINAYNLIDGVDGLAAGIAAIAAFVFGVLFLIQSDFLFALLAFSFLGSLLAFLRFNFQPAKIFMGDTGSLIIGLLMASFFLRIFQSQHSTLNATAFSLLLLPLIDMSRLFIVRILTKKSPFAADHNHYHHLLIKSGDCHKNVAISGYVIVILHAVIGFVVSLYFDITLSFIISFASALLMYVFVSLKYFNKARQKSKLLLEKMNETKQFNTLINPFHEK